MIRTIRWCGYAWLAAAATLAIGLLALEWQSGGIDQVVQWLTVEYLIIFCASLAPGAAMVLMEVLFEGRHGVNEDH